MQEMISKKDKISALERNSKTPKQSTSRGNWWAQKSGNFLAIQIEVRAESAFGGIPNIDSQGELHEKTEHKDGSEAH